MALSPKSFNFSLLLLLSLLITTANSLPSSIGVTYNPTANPSPEKAATTLESLRIAAVRLPEPDPPAIRAFSYSNISILISIPNSAVSNFAANRSAAMLWLDTHVVPFYPRARITAISVGADFMKSASDSADLIPAIRNLHLCLRDLGIHKVAVSTTFSFVNVITTAFPPSAAEFQEPVAEILIKPLLEFLEETNSSFFVNVHPYFVYKLNADIPIGHALFQKGPFNFRDDHTTGFRYRNLFDSMVDAVIGAIARAGHANIPVVVTETGWPSSGDSDANEVYAGLYVKGLIDHLRSGIGTPLRKEGVAVTYIYELFNSDGVKQGRETGEQQWGILYQNMTNKYGIKFSSGAVNPGGGSPGNLADGDENICTVAGVLDYFLRPAAMMPSLSRYMLKKRIGKGGFGETWLAFHTSCYDTEEQKPTFCQDPYYSASSYGCKSHGNSFVIKRIMVERGRAAYLSGLREKHFGELLLQASLENEGSFEHIGRYMQTIDCGRLGLWMVSRNEGVSLFELLYSAHTGEGTTAEATGLVLQRSAYWRWLKTTSPGREEMRNLIWQLLMALRTCHDLNIVHRDIKPGNMVVCFQEERSRMCIGERPAGDKHREMKMRLIDFGSSVDDFSKRTLYGLDGPSSAEQTYLYAPPEAMRSGLPANYSVRSTYDMWSVGVVTLELILGSPDVFKPRSRVRSTLVWKYQDLTNYDFLLLNRFKAFVEMCIKIPRNSPYLGVWREEVMGGLLSPLRRCSDKNVASHIKKVDPLRIGFPDQLALQFVRQILMWNPEERLNVSAALAHPYFQQWKPHDEL